MVLLWGLGSLGRTLDRHSIKKNKYNVCILSRPQSSTLCVGVGVYTWYIPYQFNIFTEIDKWVLIGIPTHTNFSEISNGFDKF